MKTQTESNKLKFHFEENITKRNARTEANNLFIHFNVYIYLKRNLSNYFYANLSKRREEISIISRLAFIRFEGNTFFTRIRPTVIV